MPEDIDYEQLFKDLQRENETLRLKIWNLSQGDFVGRIMGKVGHWIVGFINDPERFAALCILSITLHTHFKLWKAWHDE